MENQQLFLFYDIAPTHRSVLVKDLLAKIKVTTLEPLPYSPDVAEADFCLLPPLKSSLKCWRFCDATDITQDATEEPKWLSHDGFQECFQYLYSR